MHILVAGAFEASSHWAHAINTVKMAQGFARLGHKVTIVCRQSPGGKVPPEKLAQMYGLTEPLRWVQLPWKVLGYPVYIHWRFALLALPIAIWMRPDLVFARSYIFPWLSSKCGIATVAESHTGPDNNTAPFLRLVDATRHRAFRLWVTISQRLADHYHSLGVPMEKLIVLPDAFDLDLFQRPARLPPRPYPGGAPVVAYTGHYYEDYKGIPTVLEAAALLPEVQFHLVGGQPQEVARHQARIQEMGLGNVTLHGLKPHSEVPPFLWHADVLLMPPSARHPSAAWTSPVKLGEYLASGTPIVATAIPALRDWLTDEEVEFVAADNAEAMAAGIRHLLDNRARAEALSQAGIRKARELSYERRTEAILKRVGLVVAQPRSSNG
jgi:glycosyltransferase involved in cell wall biosynthesis